MLKKYAEQPILCKMEGVNTRLRLKDVVKKQKKVLTKENICDNICKLIDEADSTLNEYTSAENKSEKIKKKS